MVRNIAGNGLLIVIGIAVPAQMAARIVSSDIGHLDTPAIPGFPLFKDFSRHGIGFLHGKTAAFQNAILCQNAFFAARKNLQMMAGRTLGKAFANGFELFWSGLVKRQFTSVFTDIFIVVQKRDRDGFNAAFYQRTQFFKGPQMVFHRVSIG